MMVALLVHVVVSRVLFGLLQPLQALVRFYFGKQTGERVAC